MHSSSTFRRLSLCPLRPRPPCRSVRGHLIDVRGDRHIRKRLVDWLEKLGLGQHAQRFAENDISFVGIRLNHGVRGRQVVRFHFIFSAVIAFVAATMLTKCGNSSVVWEHYDQCALENPSFLAMAECGRRKRLAACEPNNTCSPEILCSCST